MRKYQIIIYGSYGYTGSLITHTCKAKNIKVLLAGRDEEKLQQQSTQTGYPFEVAEINDTQQLQSVLEKGQVVIHCGGPFQYTAAKMVEACLKTQTHYTDITGEYEVFEALAGFDQQAKAAGIIVMGGVGFDVVPSDCLAVHLKKKLPTATHLQLGFVMSKGGMSRGTSKTMVESLGSGSTIRKDNKLVSVPLGEKVMPIDFGSFQSQAMCIPWGDIATAWRSTSIPNIEVYSGMPEKTIRIATLANWFNFILRKRWVKNILLAQVDKKVAGPSEEKIKNSRSYLWGKVWDANGTSVESRLETPNGYLLTALTATLIGEEILTSEVRPGYYTPAQYFGEDFILRIPGTKRTDV